jgi:hypothetical protein
MDFAGKKSESKYEKTHVKIAVVNLFIVILLLINAICMLLLSCQMNRYIEYSEIMPQLFIKGPIFYSDSAESNKIYTYPSDLKSVTYTLSNLGANSAFRVRSLRPFLCMSSRFLIDNIDLKDDCYEVMSLESNGERGLNDPVFCSENMVDTNISIQDNDSLFLHFYYEYTDIFRKKHFSYFIFWIGNSMGDSNIVDSFKPPGLIEYDAYIN